MASGANILVPGPVTISWDNKDLGISLDGVVLRMSEEWEPIVADKWGRSIIDSIYLGKNVIVECTGLEFKDICFAHPWAAYVAAKWSLNGAVDDVIGGLATAIAKALKITQRDAKFWEAQKAILVGPRDLRLAVAPEFRFPLTFQLFKDSSGYLFSTIPSY